MFAIVAKADGAPISRRVEGVSPDPIVTWVSESAAKGFLAAKQIEADYQVVALTDDSLGRIAQAIGCRADAIQFELYPS
jgi:hypothetical protein